MDQKTLLDTNIKLGEDLIKALDEARLFPATGFWAREEQSDFWNLNIFFDQFEDIGPSAIYKVIDGLSNELKIFAYEHALLYPSNQLSENVSKMLRNSWTHQRNKRQIISVSSEIIHIFVYRIDGEPRIVDIIYNLTGIKAVEIRNSAIGDIILENKQGTFAIEVMNLSYDAKTSEIKNKTKKYLEIVKQRNTREYIKILLIARSSVKFTLPEDETVKIFDISRLIKFIRADKDNFENSQNYVDLSETIIVDSSNIESFGYDENINILAIKFKNGSIYVYYDIPAILFNDLKIAESKGSIFATKIRNMYKYNRIA